MYGIGDNNATEFHKLCRGIWHNLPLKNDDRNYWNKCTNKCTNLTLRKIEISCEHVV